MEIQEIKQRLSIHTVLKYYGLQSDKNNMLSCPFHADDKPYGAHMHYNHGASSVMRASFILNESSGRIYNPVL